MKNILHAIILSIVSVGLFALVCALLPAISAFEPIGRAIDEISVSDIYYSAIRDRKPVDNDKFLIIDTSNSSRREIAGLIDRASEAGAAVIGLDVIFSLADSDSSGTIALQQAVRNNQDKIITAVHLNQWDEQNERYISTISTPIDSISTKKGYTNLINRSDNSYIRNYSLSGQSETPSFAQAVATHYLTLFGEEKEFEPTDEGIIDFTPQNFEVLKSHKTQAIDSLSAGRIVLLGAIKTDEDTHYTPAGPLSGVIIQAYATDTLLGSPTILPAGWIRWLTGVIMVLLSSWGFVVLRDNFESKNHTANRYTYAMLGIGNLIYPTVTILLTILLIGEIYILTNCYIPPLVIVGSLAFIPVAYDIRSLVQGLRTKRSAAVVIFFYCMASNAFAQSRLVISEEDYANLNNTISILDNKDVWGKDKEDPDVISALTNLYINNGFPHSYQYDEAIHELIYKKHPILTRYLSEAYSERGEEEKSTEMLLKFINEFKNDYSTLADWYDLALAYYFGEGMAMADYEKSRYCLDKIFEMNADASSKIKEQHYYHVTMGDNRLDALASCLKKRGHPSKYHPDASMTDYNSSPSSSNRFSARLEASLIDEDPDDILGTFPSGKAKIAITSENFLRFRSLIIRKKKNLDFIKNIFQSDDWRDKLAMGLITYHNFDIEFKDHDGKIIHENVIRYNMGDGSYSTSKSKDVALIHFKKAKSMMASAKFSDSEERDCFNRFVDAYIAICTLEESNSKELTDNYVIAASCSKIINYKYSSTTEVVSFFIREHNMMLKSAANLGNNVARTLVGSMLLAGGYAPLRYDCGKARDYLLSALFGNEKKIKPTDRVPDNYPHEDIFKYALKHYSEAGNNSIFDIAKRELEHTPRPLPEGNFTRQLKLRCEMIENSPKTKTDTDITDDAILSMLNFDAKLWGYIKPSDLKPITSIGSKSNKTDTPETRKNVSGIIYDNNGDPAIGANVTNKTTGTGAISDLDGFFTLKVNKGDKLEFTYPGCAAKDIVYDGNKLQVYLTSKNSSPQKDGKKKPEEDYYTQQSKKTTYTLDELADYVDSHPKKDKQSKSGRQPSATPKANAKTSGSKNNNTSGTAKTETMAGNTEKRSAGSVSQNGLTATSNTAAQPKTVKFKFRTADYTKFSEPEFKLTFTTNSTKASYFISGTSDTRQIPRDALKSGVFRIELPRRNCDLTVADESGQMHVLHFVYDEALSLRKSATLHILSIGVNNYPAQNLNNLKYAEADAMAVVNAIASRHKYTFANINKTLLTGNNVTPERISAEIEKIADNAGLNDLAIIFYAGHGLVDARSYYLATSKVTDSSIPRKGGLSATSFAEKISYINCKLVVFVDACYSAKMLEQFRSGAVNNSEFFKELTSTPNGTNIYTSSGADVKSREDDRYGHGVFTQALIEACDFENSDTDGDGRITITEIRNYLERRITQMTGNQQRPVNRNLEEIDYSLFIR